MIRKKMASASAASVHGNAAFFRLAEDGVAHGGMIMAC